MIQQGFPQSHESATTISRKCNYLMLDDQSGHSANLAKMVHHIHVSAGECQCQSDSVAVVLSNLDSQGKRFNFKPTASVTLDCHGYCTIQAKCKYMNKHVSMQNHTS